VNYTQTITIEREISGPQQIADIVHSKTFLQKLIDKTFRDPSGNVPSAREKALQTKRKAVPPPER
jgi:hypothetical protein